MWTDTVFLWFILGGVVAAGLLALVLWLRSKSIEVKWYDRLMGALGLLLLIFTVQNFYTSFIELVPQAAWMFLLVTGLPSVILLVIPIQLVLRRRRTA
ncbi:putative reductive dehalogenase anchoring protein (rdhB) [marine sediment metagenome]|uniref:Putative reductive dehalogenase anchoring protein (RdhB) n=1 Tax=marine sediment metagenome TaxID=412755 RepID=X1TYP2_9ZZZZ